MVPLKSSFFHLFLIFILCSCWCNFVSCDGFYTIVAPKHIHPKSIYNVSISTHGIDELSTIKIDLKGYPIIGNNFTLSQTKTIEPNSTVVIDFPIGPISDGKYNFTAEGISGIIFNNWTKLKYVPKSTLIFIQTDRAIYKPGANVKYRILALTPDMTPSSICKFVNVSIYDSNQLKVNELMNSELNLGVFSSEIQLAEDINKGIWAIKAEYSDEIFNQEFEVAEYILPKFNVKIHLPKFSTYDNKSVKVAVKAAYTYGKPVKGKLKISIANKPYDGYPKKNIATKIKPIDGVSTIGFSLRKDLKLENKFDRDFLIDVRVVEDLTGFEQSVSSEISLYVTNYRINFINPSDYFKPGLNYSISVRVNHHDGSPVIDDINPVIIYYGYDYSTFMENELKLILNRNGKVSGDIPVPRNTTKLYVKASFMNSEIELPHILRARAVKKTFISAKVLTSPLKINGNIKIQITSTHRLQRLTYHLIGRDNLLESKTLNIANRSRTSIKFKSNSLMIPKASMLVYYITNAGDLIADHLDLHFEMLDNNMKINLSPNNQKLLPGQQINVTIKTNQNSFIGLLAIDESALLLKNQYLNDLTMNRVIDNLRQFTRADDEVSPDPNRRTLLQQSEYRKNFKSFKDAGMVLFTNAKKEPKKGHLQQSEKSEGNEDYFDLDGNIIPRGKHELLSTQDAFNEDPNTRKYFPETWLWWDSLSNDLSDTITLSTTVPDTITKWILTGFSLNEQNGLSLLEKPKIIDVFRPFFITTTIPYSIKRGEIATIPIVIFNYLDTVKIINVTLHNSKKQFCFENLTSCSDSKTILIEAGNKTGTSYNFQIIPFNIGTITVRITATEGMEIIDEVEKELVVEPEGIPHYINKALVIDLRDKTFYNITIIPKIPVNYIPNSVEMKISVMDNILTSSMQNLDHLIRMPDGCGEQNMLHLVPNIVVLDYLRNTNQENEKIEKKALSFMKKAYQRQLKFRHPNGAFSAFGRFDNNGSVWLTAFVARSMYWAQKYITVDSRLINKGLKWLRKQQQEDGSFYEIGQTIFRPDEVDESCKTNVTLTAFTILAFLENNEKRIKYNETITNALNYMNEQIKNIGDIYAISIAAYAMQLANHTSKDELVKTLERYSQNTGTKKWWKANKAETEINFMTIQTTAYALLTFLEANKVDESVPITKWLISQRNSNGGFFTSQDTIVGIHALAKFAEKFHFMTRNIMNIAVNGENIMRSENNVETSPMRTLKIEQTRKNIVISAEGHGFAIVDFSMKYNLLNWTEKNNHFEVHPIIENNEVDSDLLNLTICTRYNSKFNSLKNYTNMALVEVYLPTGYAADRNSFPPLTNNDLLKKVEIIENDSKVVFYYNRLDSEQICPHLQAFKAHQIQRQQRGIIRVYDYYDTSLQTTIFY